MPNWCYNYLRVNGPKDQIKKITNILDAETAKGNAGKVFEPLVGIKPELTREEYDNGGWYDANIDYWGCKWDINAAEWSYDSDGNEIVMSFDSAWSPASGFAQLLAKQYGVEVKLEFNESGNYFAGYLVAGPDMEPEYHSWDYMEGLYNTDPEEFWHRFGQNIWDSFDDGEPLELEELLTDKEYAFFTKEDKENARRHYEIQKADVMRYLEEVGTLDERLQKFRADYKEQQD